jgi:hypothetical protein
MACNLKIGLVRVWRASSPLLPTWRGSNRKFHGSATGKKLMGKKRVQFIVEILTACTSDMEFLNFRSPSQTASQETGSEEVDAWWRNNACLFGLLLVPHL